MSNITQKDIPSIFNLGVEESLLNRIMIGPANWNEIENINVSTTISEMEKGLIIKRVD